MLDVPQPAADTREIAELTLRSLRAKARKLGLLEPSASGDPGAPVDTMPAAETAKSAEEGERDLAELGTGKGGRH